MCGPAGDDWGGPDWKGWRGDNPPYNAPTFNLTHHARPPIVIEGGTTFHFGTEGIEAALAKAAAGDKDMKISGGALTIRHYLRAGAIDEMHLVVPPSFWAEASPCSQALTCRASAIGDGDGAGGVGRPPRADALTVGGPARARNLFARTSGAGFGRLRIRQTRIRELAGRQCPLFAHLYPQGRSACGQPRLRGTVEQSLPVRVLEPNWVKSDFRLS